LRVILCVATLPGCGKQRATGRVILGEKDEQYAYRMGPIVIFPLQRVVTRDGALEKVGSTLFNLVVYFAENRGVVLGKLDIIRGSWLKVHVTDGTLSNYVGQARDLIGQEAIVTVFNQGYKVVAPVERLSGKDAEPPVSSLLPRIVKLPRRPSPLVGRELELAQVADLVRDHRLISLVGPGGVGKTRLATEVAWQLVKKFVDGSVMIDLAPLGDAAAVTSALAQAFDLPLQDTGTPLANIAEAIRDRQVLLTLDNCEHIGAIVVDIIKVLKGTAPDLTILLTSQHALDGIYQEVYRLNGLPAPPEGLTDPAKIAEYDAIKLFTQRAHSNDRDFAYNDGNAVAVAEICRRLDGVPLSLEMAATLVYFLKIEGLRNRLDQRFALLKMDPGTAVKRHISLQDMTEWSYGLLEPQEQHFFCRLGVFPSWFSASEAAAIAGADGSDPLELLRSLVKKSLVVSQDNAGPEPRFRLLETLRLYAVRQLDANGERRAMAERFLRAVIDLFTGDLNAWETLSDARLRELYAPQIDNLRAALDSALGDPDLAPDGIALLGLSGRLWSILLLIPEGQGYFDRFMPLVGKDTPPADAALVLRHAAILCRHTDRLRSVKLLKQAATIYRKLKDKLSLGAVLAMLGGEYIYLGLHKEAKAALDQAWKLLSGSNRVKSLQDIMTSSGNLAWIRNEIAEAVRCLAIAGAMAEQLQDDLRKNIVLNNLAELECRRDALVPAMEHAQDSADGLRAAGERYRLAQPLTNLAAYKILDGDHADALIPAREALPILIEESGHWLWIHLQIWACAAALAGLVVEAAQILGWSDGVQARTKEIREPTEQKIDDITRAIVTAKLKPSDLESFLVKGAHWSEAHAVDYLMRRIVSSDRLTLLRNRSTEPSGSQDAPAKSAASGA
jgi:predicted ATPase/DNA-binding winged helix-turn-helix (wHTH) protein